MEEKYSSFGGYTNGVSVDMVAIDKIKEADLQDIKLIKQYQPNTKNVFVGAGPDAWHSSSYIRQREMYGPADLGYTTEG